MPGTCRENTRVSVPGSNGANCYDGAAAQIISGVDSLIQTVRHNQTRTRPQFRCHYYTRAQALRFMPSSTTASAQSCQLKKPRRKRNVRYTVTSSQRYRRRHVVGPD
jgi:hypothetical protein